MWIRRRTFFSGCDHAIGQWRAAEYWRVQWPVGPLPPSGQVMDYGMDPDVVNNPAYSSTIQNDLKSIPTFSIVMNPQDFWGTNGIYANPGQMGRPGSGRRRSS
jgi:hypothetical protein